MKRFYINATYTTGQQIEVPDEVVRHMHVLRLRNDEIVEIFDGNNHSYLAKIILLQKRQIIIEIIEVISSQPIPSTSITLAISLISNDKMDLVIQKSVELGVNNIIPILSERSQRFDNNRIANRLSHWQNIIISSCCQCGQNQLPQICSPISLQELYATKSELKIIMTPYDNKLSERAPLTNKNIQNSLLLVGPEGGFTDIEVKDALENNFIPLQLGNLIMRAETAAIAGLSLLNLHLKYWNAGILTYDN